MKKKIVSVGYGDIKPIQIGDRLPLVYVGGPCAIESKDHAFKMAEMIGDICRRVCGDVLFNLEAPQIGWPQIRQLPRVDDGRDHLDAGSFSHRDCDGNTSHQISGRDERHHGSRSDHQSDRHAMEVGLRLPSR